MVGIVHLTRQPLFIHQKKADDLFEFYEDEGFDLYSYKTHPSLPVTVDDRVFESVFVLSDPQQAHNAGKTYSFPEGRLMKLPLAEVWDDE